MKKKLVSALLILTVLCSMIVIPTTSVSAASYGYVPLNIRSYLTHEGNTTDLCVELYNNTYSCITGYETIVYFYNAYGNIIPDENGNSYRMLYKDDVELEHYDIDYGYMYYDYYIHAASVSISKVYFADGTTWTNPGDSNLYTEANFIIANDTTPYGNYIINDAHEVVLLDTSYSSYKRDWYIWNDGVGWVWFSDELIPICTVWKTGAAIKLVINGNPNLYKVINFNVTPQPNFIAKYRNGSTTYNSNITYTPTIYTGYYASAPYYIDLWDNNEYYGQRAWYIWNDGAGWVWFSNERGPACQIWSKGEHDIKLVYDNDEDTAEIFTFKIN